MQKADKGEKIKNEIPSVINQKIKMLSRKKNGEERKPEKEERKKERKKKKASMVSKDQRNHEQKENNFIYKGYNPPDNRGSLKVIFLFFPNSFYDHSLIEANNAANQTPIT